jgi:hypothetical protein
LEETFLLDKYLRGQSGVVFSEVEETLALSKEPVSLVGNGDYFSLEQSVNIVVEETLTTFLPSYK